jgi:MFS transporter, FSR family, fosmidomycin resistance protein
MSQLEQIPQIPIQQPVFDSTKLVLPVVAAVSFVHLLNDLIQAVLPAIYPMLKADYNLSFTQVGLITLVFQLTASVLQPGIGFYTDKHPKPYLLPAGMVFTLVGLIMLSVVNSFTWLLIASAFIGLGSSAFHPEASRVARTASGGRFGFAQAFFQVGGNSGTALGPLLAAAIVIQRGQASIAWFTIFAVIGIVVLLQVSRWTIRTHAALKASAKKPAQPALPRNKIVTALSILALLVFSKYVYMTSLSSYYTFYLIEKFQQPVATTQLFLFLFLAAVAVGTFAGGPIGDRIGRKLLLWISILGVAPFTLMLPYCNLFWTGVLTVFIGLVLSSAFSAIIVSAQELVPGRIGLISGIFYGLMFGFSGISAAALGALADATDIIFVFKCCSFLPLLGIVTVFLPKAEYAEH